MEEWRVWALWSAVGFNLAAGVWSLVAAVRRERKAARLDREAYGRCCQRAAAQHGDSAALGDALVDRRGWAW